MPPLIRRPRGLSGWEIGLAVSVGIVSGFYIWRPVFQKTVGLDKVYSVESEKEKSQE